MDQAMAAGHQVTAIVRNTSSITHQATATGQLKVVAADVTNPAHIRPHVHDADAVISTLGARGVPMRATTVCSDAIESILEAMQCTGVQRLIAMSAADFGNTQRDGMFMRHVARPLVLGFLHGTLRDLRVMEDNIVASDFQWTIVRAPQLLNQVGGQYRVSIGKNLSGAVFARRSDVAHVMLQHLDNPVTFRKFVTVAR